MGEREHWLNEKDAAVRVGRSERTIRAWLSRDWLSAETVATPEGPRERRILVDELLAVAAAHGGIHRHDRGELLARIEELERRIEALEAIRRPYVPVARREANLSDLAGEVLSTRAEPASVPGEPVAHAQQRPQRDVSQRNAGRWEPMPDGAMAFTRWCKSRAVDHRSIERLIGAGRMPQPRAGKWQPPSGGVPIGRIYLAEDIAAADARLQGVPAEVAGGEGE